MQIVAPKKQIIPSKRMAVERVHHMLLIAIVVVMGACAVRHEIGLIVLIVGIREFEMTGVIPSVATFQSCAIGIEMIVVGVALAGTEEVTATTRECQLVSGAPRQSFLHIVGRLPIKAAQVRIVVQHRLVVRQALCLLHQFEGNLLGGVGLWQINGIDLRVLETGLGVPFLRVKRETGSVTPLMAEGVIA